MSDNGLFITLAVSGFVATFSLLALGGGIVLMVFSGSRAFAKRLVVVGLALVVVSMAVFFWVLPQLPK